MNINEFCEMVDTLKTTLSKYNFSPGVVISLFCGDFQERNQILHQVSTNQISEKIASFIANNYLCKIKLQPNDIRFVEEIPNMIDNAKTFLYEMNIDLETTVTIILDLYIIAV